MPIVPPRLDDRSFEDLVAELLERIPAHTPEWTQHSEADPGRTLIELFAWLGDTILYRANLIPERQRLQFLSLLGQHLRPAAPASGLITVGFDDEEIAAPVVLAPSAVLDKPVHFETLTELTVLPLVMEVYGKRPLADDESRDLADVLEDLRELYRISGPVTGYVTTPVFANGSPDPAGYDVISQTVDRNLWLALLAPSAELVEDVRTAVGGGAGTPSLVSIGVSPALTVPALSEQVGPRGRLPVDWEITSGRTLNGATEYLSLEVQRDSTEGLTRDGVVRLQLPSEEHLGAPTNDVDTDVDAGVGDRPPRLDDPERAARLVSWIRLKPRERIEALTLSWVGGNAVEIDQRTTVRGRVVGTGTGAADQVFGLSVASVEASTLQLEVEEPGLGYRVWGRTDDLALSGTDDRVFELDQEAGLVRFGDGARGRVPATGMRIRIARMRAGGGAAGNLPAGTLKDLVARTVEGGRPPRLSVQQPMALSGGIDAETLIDAERRIPSLLRHRDRAVTGDDFRELAARTPGARVGRVEVLNRFKPHQRRFDVPGIVSVMVLPHRAEPRPPNPRPDRPFIERVHGFLSERRPVTAELYVIGCEYEPLGVGVGIQLAEGTSPETVFAAVRDAIRNYLWSLSPGGPSGSGWPLGRAVGDRELEVVAAQVDGVGGVVGVNLFRPAEAGWEAMARVASGDPVALTMQPWQLPELLGVVVADGSVPQDLRGVINPFAGDDREVAVPVVPEVC